MFKINYNNIICPLHYVSLIKINKNGEVNVIFNIDLVLWSFDLNIIFILFYDIYIKINENNAIESDYCNIFNFINFI